MAGVSENERTHAFACERSQRARLVKPTMTASITYCERVAAFARS